MRSFQYFILAMSVLIPVNTYADSSALLSAINQVQLGTSETSLYSISKECTTSDIRIWSQECTLKNGVRVLVQLAPDNANKRLLSWWRRSIRNNIFSNEDERNELKNKANALEKKIEEEGLPIAIRALRFIAKDIERSEIEKIASNFASSNKLGPVEKSRHYKAHTRSHWGQKDEHGNTYRTQSIWVNHINWDTKSLIAFSESSDDNRKDYQFRYGWMDIENKWPYDKPKVSVVLTAYTGEAGVHDRITASDPKKDYGWVTRLLDVVFPWRSE